MPGAVEHGFTHFPLRQSVYVASVPAKTKAPEGMRWVALAELSGEALPNVFRKVAVHAGLLGSAGEEMTMATGNDLRRLALALEGTTEAPHFDRAAFKVARIYVTLAADGKTANFKFTPDEQEFKCMMAPDAFAPVPNAWGKQGWTTATLSKIKVAELKAALEMAYQHALPVKKKKRR